ncbi:presenilin-1-like [Ornithodoros turicata]|uniref:presenilin-1-like n=1 Tax=Ornithodoros turicata TaxID=34597 RepID=UPI0031398621
MEDGDLPLSPEEAEDFWDAIEEVLWNVVSLIIAVTCCMSLVATIVYATPPVEVNEAEPPPQLQYTPFPESNVTQSQRTINSFSNAFLFIGVVAMMTCIMVALFYYQCYAIMCIWVMLGSCFILLMSSIIFIWSVFKYFNVPIDIITTAFVIWNFVATGLIVIHRKGPLVLQQAYLIVESAFMAILLLSAVPPATLWIILAIIPIWDMVAVLCAAGPLKILVETAKERKEGLQPGLVFATLVMTVITSVRRVPGGSRRTSLPASSKQPPPSRQPPLPPMYYPEVHAMQQPMQLVQPQWELGSPRREEKPQRLPVPTAKHREVVDEDDDEEESESEGESEGIKMGLGDFVFYSVLVGKVALGGDLVIIATCMVAVIMGMCLTLMMLVVVQKALPALPFSLGLGLIFASFSDAIYNFNVDLVEWQVHV